MLRKTRASPVLADGFLFFIFISLYKWFQAAKKLANIIQKNYYPKMIEKISIKDILKPILVPINNEAWIFVFLFASITILLFLIHPITGYMGCALTIWCILFFRDPKRQTPITEQGLIAPADGTVQNIIATPPPPELNLPNTPLQRISIFMNVFNVHINRIPSNGTITQLNYRKGQFLSADLDKASEKNERQSIVMETANKDQIIITQIAGLVARRILCRLKENDTVEAGQKFGLIRFGSRVDVYLPPNYQPSCAIGQTIIGGETIIASKDNKEPMISAEKNFIANYDKR